MDYSFYKENALIVFLLVFKFKTKHVKVTTHVFASSFKNVLPLHAQQLINYQILRTISQYKKLSLINSLFFLKIKSEIVYKHCLFLISYHFTLFMSQLLQQLDYLHRSRLITIGV